MFRRSQGTRIADLWRPLLDRSDVFILDSETTGLGEQDEFCDFALLDTQGRVRASHLVLPTAPIHPGAARTHGLSLDYLRRMGARPYPHVHAEIQAVMRDCRIILGWNVEFDGRIWNQTLTRYGLVWDEKIEARDLMAEHNQYLPGSFKLETVAQNLNLLTASQDHRALSDCQLVLRVMQAYVAQDPPSNPEPMTARQAGYLKSLIQRSEYDSMDEMRDRIWPERRHQPVSRYEASSMIDRLK